MLGLGSNISKTGKLGVHDLGIVTSNLVLKHNYDLSSVQPLSSGAASFNGTSDYIDCGDLGAAKSLAFWFKTSTNITSSSNYQRAFGFSSSYYGISLGASTGSLSGEVLTVLTDNSSRTGTTTTFDSNTWYHVCISWNDSSDYFDIYINGVLSTDLSTGTHTLADWDSFIIGTDNTGGTHFGGYMCNIGVWSAALSQAQIKSIMNKNYDSLSDSEKTDLVSWWTLDSVIPDTTTLVYDNHHGGGEILGGELVDDGDFSLTGTQPASTAGTYWSTGSKWTISGGKAVLESTTSGGSTMSQSSVFTVGELYKITLDAEVTAGSAKIEGSGGATALTINTTKTYEFYWVASITSLVFNRISGTTSATISNISVKQVNGNTGTLS